MMRDLLLFFYLLYRLSLDRQSINSTDRHTDRQAGRQAVFMLDSYLIISAMCLCCLGNVHTIHSNAHNILYKKYILVVVMYPKNFWYSFGDIVRFWNFKKFPDLDPKIFVALWNKIFPYFGRKYYPGMEVQC